MIVMFLHKLHVQLQLCRCNYSCISSSSSSKLRYFMTKVKASSTVSSSSSDSSPLYDASALFYNTEINRMASEPVSPVSLQKLLRFGRNVTEKHLLVSAKYLQKELPVRVAHRIDAFFRLPYIVCCNPHIKAVFNKYLMSLDRLRDSQPVTGMEKESKFTNLLQALVDDHVDVIDLLGKGVREATRYASHGSLDQFLDNTLRSRIGMRVLAEQHIALHNSYSAGMKEMKSGNNEDDFIGIVCRRTPPARVVEKCANIVGEMCERLYGVAPVTIINGHIDAAISYIPVHLEYILLELLKNSYRATVEHNIDNRHDLPPVCVTICEGPNDVCIRIADEGGGIHPMNIESVWKYSFSTANTDVKDPDFGAASGLMQVTMAQQQSPLFGLGFGLPMSRVYAEYFGGDIQLQSLHGYGCRAYLTLNNIGDEKIEV